MTDVTSFRTIKAWMKRFTYSQGWSVKALFYSEYRIRQMIDVSIMPVEIKSKILYELDQIRATIATLQSQTEKLESQSRRVMTVKYFEKSIELERMMVGGTKIKKKQQGEKK